MANPTALREIAACDLMAGSLLPCVRRVGIEDDVSPLVQLLKKGHHDVVLDAEAWSRLVTWIDLNAPCHGMWGDAFPLPAGVHERRMALRKQLGGPEEDPEAVVHPTAGGRSPKESPRPKPAARPAVDAGPIADFGLQMADWPGRKVGAAVREQVVDLGGGVTLKRAPISAGEFLMGNAQGQPDERPLARVAIARPYWMGACEVTNEQYRRFNASFAARYYGKRHARPG